MGIWIEWITIGACSVLAVICILALKDMEN